MNNKWMLSGSFLVLFYLLYLPVDISAQTGKTKLRGMVVDESGEGLPGAHIILLGKEQNTIVADEHGDFTFPFTDSIEVSYVGYQTQRFAVKMTREEQLFTLTGVKDLNTVVVKDESGGSFISTLNSRNTEQMGMKEFRKAACCNLSESFDTNPTIDANYPDAVTGIREISMLGLRGLYTQLMTENKQMFTGIGTPFLLDNIPGTWLRSVQITKGAGSVINGYQSTTGQINVEMQNPLDDKPVFVNLFTGTNGRLEANVHLNKIHKPTFMQGLYLHGSTVVRKIDHNDDGWMDMPLRETLGGMYKVLSYGKKWEGQWTVKGTYDLRKAGQIVASSAQEIYNISQNNQRVEFTGKTGYIGFDNKDASLGFIYSGVWHKMNAQYGLNKHRGEQKSAYLQSLFASPLGRPDHKLNAGLSFRMDDVTESLSNFSGVLNRREIVPGAYLEYNYDGFSVGIPGEKKTLLQRTGLVVGLRVDHHNLFGWLVTPRVHGKVNLTEQEVIRFSFGRGYRTPYFIAENASILVSNRQIQFLGNLQMERAWNTGVNYTKNFGLWKRAASISVDAYHTWFDNQLVIDQDADFNTVYFYNLEGSSRASSFLAAFTSMPLNGLEIKLAGKYNLVQTSFKDAGLRDVPMIPRWRGLLALDYQSPDKKWGFNLTLPYTGSQRLPDNKGVPHQLLVVHGEKTPAFVTLNAQVTRRWKQWELYVGGENMTNYTQHRAIIAPDDPYGPYFNATQVYAPIMGIQGYAGLRWWMN